MCDRHNPKALHFPWRVIYLCGFCSVCSEQPYFCQWKKALEMETGTGPLPYIQQHEIWSSHSVQIIKAFCKVQTLYQAKLWASEPNSQGYWKPPIKLMFSDAVYLNTQQIPGKLMATVKAQNSWQSESFCVRPLVLGISVYKWLIHATAEFKNANGSSKINGLKTSRGSFLTALQDVYETCMPWYSRSLCYQNRGKAAVCMSCPVFFSTLTISH